MIQLPISIGYSIEKERSRLFTEFGVNLGIYAHFDGKLFDTESTILSNPDGLALG